MGTSKLLGKPEKMLRSEGGGEGGQSYPGRAAILVRVEPFFKSNGQVVRTEQVHLPFTGKISLLESYVFMISVNELLTNFPIIMASH